MIRQRKVAFFGVLALVLALAVPAVSSAASKTDKKQNKSIGALVKGLAKTNKNVKAANKKLTAITATIGSQGKSITDVDTRLKTIESSVPIVTKALTDLQTGLTTVGAGLTSLKTLATSTEYGFGQVVVVSAGPVLHPQVGAFVETPNVPDDVQQAQTTQQFKNGPDAGNLLVSYGVRSTESDGDGTTPAALCRVWVTNTAGTTDQTAPNVGLGGLPFQPVLTKSATTSTTAGNTGFGFGLKQNPPDADVTQNFVSTVPVAANETYTVGMSCIDTSASTTDPSA
jgi:hypothetical protein